MAEVRFGIDNLFDVQPERTFMESERVNYLGELGPGYSAAGDTNENFYDFLGRRWYVGFTMSF